MAMLGLHCCTGFSLAVVSKGHALVAGQGLLIAVAPHVAEHGLQGVREQLWHVGSAAAVPGLYSTGSMVMVHRLSCSVACGIFPDQESSPCLLHCQVDSLPLNHQRRPGSIFMSSLSLTLGHQYLSERSLYTCLAP